MGGAARRAELNERVAALEATAASAFRDDSDGDAFSKESSLFSSSLLSGVWRLVYTDAFETLAVLRIANAMPGVTAGRLTQTIRDLDGANADSVNDATAAPSRLVAVTTMDVSAPLLETRSFVKAELVLSQVHKDACARAFSKPGWKTRAWWTRYRSTSLSRRR